MDIKLSINDKTYQFNSLKESLPITVRCFAAGYVPAVIGNFIAFSNGTLYRKHAGIIILAMWFLAFCIGVGVYWIYVRHHDRKSIRPFNVFMVSVILYFLVVVIGEKVFSFISNMADERSFALDQARKLPAYAVLVPEIYTMASVCLVQTGFLVAHLAVAISKRFKAKSK